MENFTPSIPISLQIRNIIYQKFNDPETRFTNDEIFEIMKNSGDVDSSWTIDTMEPYFEEICNAGLVRNIAQNFTTIWLKLFDKVEKIHCNSCDKDNFFGKSEKRICINPDCKKPI